MDRYIAEGRANFGQTEDDLCNDFKWRATLENPLVAVNFTSAVNEVYEQVGGALHREAPTTYSDISIVNTGRISDDSVAGDPRTEVTTEYTHYTCFSFLLYYPSLLRITLSIL